MAAKDVGAATGLAHIAQGQLQNARGAHHGVADGVLGLAHAPNDGARAVFMQPRGHLGHLFGLDAAGLFDLVQRPFGHHVFFDLVHAIDPVVDVFFIFPTVLEDDVQQTKQERDVRARTDAHILVGLGRGAGKARVDHDHLGAGFFGVQHVQQADGVGLGGIGADVQSDLAVLHIVVRVGHGPITPGVGHTRHRGGVANARLVVAVVAAPKTHEFAQQIRLLVVVLARTHPVNGVRATGLAQLHQFGRYLIERLVPADALVLAIHQLHGVAQTELTMTVFAQCRALGAMRAQVDGRVKHGFLAHPDTVFNHRIDGTTHRTVGTHRALDLDLAGPVALVGACSLGLFHQGQLAGRQAHTHAQTRAAQKSAAVHGRDGLGQTTLQTVHKR